MSKKRNIQSVEVNQRGVSLSTLEEQIEHDDQLPLPAGDIQEEECPQCHGIGVIPRDGEEVPCPRCSGIPLSTTNTVEATATALAGQTASAAGATGQPATPGQTCNSVQPTSFGGAEECCPNCQGRKFFTEKVMNDEGKLIDTTIKCHTCNGRGYIIIPLYSPVLAQERAMVSKWPTEAIEINWPWVTEPDPVVGTIVGWNWETEEVAVITKQPKYLNMKPWRVTIDLKPMPKNLLSCLVIGIDEPVVHKDVNWYATWTRTGEKDLPDTDAPATFFGRCAVQELA